MPISRIVIVRHALRLDTVDKQWLFTSATPYDSPLVNPRGFTDARTCGEKIYEKLLEKGTGAKGPVIVHSSPFLRCVQTAAEVSQSLKDLIPASDQRHSDSQSILDKALGPVIRIDSVFGEWLTEDYYQHIPPPPSDQHVALRESSLQWLKMHCKGPTVIDDSWDLHKFGYGGETGESWTTMHERVGLGIKKLIEYYNGHKDNVQGFEDDVSEGVTIVIVTHGALCNSLLAHLSNQPLLQKIALSSFAIAEPYDKYTSKSPHTSPEISSDWSSDWQHDRASDRGSDRACDTTWAIVYNSSMKQRNSSEMLQFVGGTPTAMRPMFSPSSLSVSPATLSTGGGSTLGPTAPALITSPSNSSSTHSLHAFFGSNNENTISQNINSLDLDKDQYSGDLKGKGLRKKTGHSSLGLVTDTTDYTDSESDSTNSVEAKGEAGEEATKAYDSPSSGDDLTEDVELGLGERFGEISLGRDGQGEAAIGIGTGGTSDESSEKSGASGTETPLMLNFGASA